MEVRSCDCNGNCNGQRNTSRAKNHSKSNGSENSLYKRGIGRGSSLFFDVLTGNILEIDPCRQKRAAARWFGRRALISSRARSRVRRKRGGVYCGRPELRRISGSAGLSCDRDENVAMVPNVLLSQGDEVFPATVTTTECERNDTVGSTLKWGEGNAVCDP